MAVEKKPKPIIAPQRSNAGPLLMDNQNAKKPAPLSTRPPQRAAHEQKGRLKPTHQGRATRLKPISTYSLPRYFSNCGLKPIWSGA